MAEQALDFHAIAKEKGMKSDVFPHAKLGLKILNLIWLLVKVFIVSLIVAFIAQATAPFITDAFRGVAQSGAEAVSGASKSLGNSVGSLIVIVGKVLKAVVDGLEQGGFALAELSFWCIIFSIVAYMAVCVMRWRSWERDCFKSDMEARSLKAQLLGRLNINERIREAKQKRPKDEDKLALATEDAVDALKCIKRMQVYVNTRQSLDGDEIMRRYSITIDMPAIQSTTDKVTDLIKDLDKVATNVTKGKVSFGQMTIASDRTSVSYSDAIIVPDKYDYEEAHEEVVEEFYEYTFPLALLIDQQPKIDKIKDSAITWANNTAEFVDRMLATGKEAVKRLKVDVGNANALITYEMSFRLDQKKFDQLGESLDNALKTTGSSVSVHEGDLLVTIPLPTKYKIPINVPTMYREVFGTPAPDTSQTSDVA